MPPTLTFHGAAGQVTGSCTLLESQGKRLLVDCGLDQSRYGHRDRGFDFDPATLDAVCLTHGHLDHVGRVPELFELGYRGKVYCHYATGELASIVWDDSYRLALQNRDTSFGEEALELACKSFHYLDYGEDFETAGFRGKLYDAGHILGSSHVSIQAEGRRLLFSGDIGVPGTPIIADPTSDWDEGHPGFDAVVIESTYGDRDHKSREGTVEEFGSIVKRTLEERGVLLIPSFSIGRTQEILYHFNTLTESGRIARFPVFLDSPMARKVTRLYSQYTICYDEETIAQIEGGDKPLDFPGFHATEDHRQSQALHRYRPPFAIIAGSGMCTGGRILGHLKQFLPEATTTVMMVGYQGRGTLGRELLEGAPSVRIDGKSIPVKARTETLGGFSAHADRSGLLKWASQLPGSEIRWLVNHGENHASDSLARALEGFGRGPAEVVREGRRYGV